MPVGDGMTIKIRICGIGGAGNNAMTCLEGLKGG